MGEWPADLRLVGVANKVGSPDDEAYIESELAGLGVPLWASIPRDPAIASAERRGQPLVSLHSETAARRAVAALAERLSQVAATSGGTPAAASA